MHLLTVLGGDNVSPLVEIVLTDLPKSVGPPFTYAPAEISVRLTTENFCVKHMKQANYTELRIHLQKMDIPALEEVTMLMI